MATSSPRGGRGCTSELAGGALLETALREVGEVAVSTTSPGTAPSLGRGSRLSWPLRLPEGVPAGARPPPTAGPPPALSPRSSWLFQASRTPSLGTWSVHGNTLGPAHRPRKCEAAAKPRPARVYGNCPQASNSTPLATTIRPRAMTATLDSLLPARSPAGTCPRGRSRLWGRWGCALPDRGRPGLAWPASCGGQ